MAKLYDFRGTEKMVISGLGTTDIHNDLFGRSVADAHPIGAITGLQVVLDDHEARLVVNEALLVNHETRISANESDIAALDGRITILEDDLTLAVQVNDDPTNDFIYIGEAQPGTLTSAATWRIKRIEFTNPGVDEDLETLWADGDAQFDNIWDNHLALSYS